VAKTKTARRPAAGRKRPAAPRVKKPAARAAKRSPAAPAQAAVRIARVAKGRKPLYFSDPAIDKLLWMTMTLMEELSVTRDRLDTVERLLEGKRVLRRRDIESYVPGEAAGGERASRRAAFVERMMRAVEAELEEVAGGPATAAADDPVAAVSS
jgi:hypothetical protein